MSKRSLMLTIRHKLAIISFDPGKHRCRALVSAYLDLDFGPCFLSFQDFVRACESSARQFDQLADVLETTELEIQVLFWERRVVFLVSVIGMLFMIFRLWIGD